MFTLVLMLSKSKSNPGFVVFSGISQGYYDMCTKPWVGLLYVAQCSGTSGGD